MKPRFFKKFVFLLGLGFWISGSGLSAVAASPELLGAKKEAETGDFIFETSHDNIVAKARQEGKLRLLSELQPRTSKEMGEAFKQKYPFIDVSTQEFTGTEVAQRFLLELKARSIRDRDIMPLFPDFYSAFAPYAKKFDILRMAQHKVLSIPIGIIDPNNRTIVASQSAISVVAYNKNLISSEKVPNAWEDFLRPELKGKKFLVDIRPLGFAALAAGMGEQWVLNYARKLKEQEPIWVRGHTRALTAMVAGEYALFQLTNYHGCMRMAKKDPTGSLVCKIIEPVPVRIQGAEAVINDAPNPYAALLWLEFEAGPEGQKIIDEYEPLTSSIYAAGSQLEKLTLGKKLVVNNWDNYDLTPKWVSMVAEVFGIKEK